MSLERGAEDYIQNDGTRIHYHIASTAQDLPGSCAEGCRSYVVDEDATYTWHNSAWSAPAAGAHPDLATHTGLGLSADTHNHDADYSAVGHTHPGGSEAFPVGAVFTSVVSTNPATLLGYGTWAAFGAGRVLVGIDAGQTEFDTVKETGGAKTHTLTEAEMPSHSHVEQNNSATTGALAGWGARDTSTNTAVATGYSTQATGGGGAHNNLQPYIVVHFWERTA